MEKTEEKKTAMIALTLPKYWERDLKPGDKFDAEPEHVQFLKESGLAKLADGDSENEIPETERRGLGSWPFPTGPAMDAAKKATGKKGAAVAKSAA